MAVTRIKNNQITDSTVVANAKLVDHSVSSNKLANDLVYGSNFTVTGNLTVQGTSTAIDTTITTIEDPVIVLASTQTTGTPLVDIGFLGYRGDQSNIAYVWDESASEFVTAFTSTGETNSTITITSYANFHTNDANVGGNLTVGGNIDITGNIANLNVTGNISGGNLLTTGVVTATGNVSGGNVTTAGEVVATGNVSGGNLTTIGITSTDSLTATTTISATGNVSGGNVTTAGEVVATGNVSGGNLTTAGQVTATGNISGNNISATNEITAGTTISATGNVSGGNVTTAGEVTATGNVSGGNVTTAGEVTATGNVSGGNVITTGEVTATGNVSGGNVITTGVVSATGNVSGNNISATNEISAGTTITATGNVAGGNITTAGEVTATGNVSGGNVTTTGVVSATGNVSGGNVTTAGEVVATGNVSGGNVTTAGLVSATGNVSGGNITTLGNVVATGNVSGEYILANTAIIGNVEITDLEVGNVTATGFANITGNITGGNISTAGIVSATGNVSGGNVTTAGEVVATGNVSGGNLTTGGVVQATGNVISPTIVTTTVTTSSGDLTLNSAGGALQWDGSGNIVMNSQWINNLSDPAQAQDAATKQYVDDAVSTGITIHTPVRLESPTDIGGTYTQGGTTATVTDTVAGNTVVFSSAIDPQVNDQYWFSNSFNGVVANTPYFVVSAPNTSAAVLSLTYSGAPVSNITDGTGLTQGVRVNSGQGATLTNNGANATLSIDGVTVSNSDRVLVYTQANAVHNGVYVVSEAGNATTAWQLTRSSDMDTYAPDDINGLDAGDYFYVQDGDTGAGESYVMTAPIGPTIIGFANLTFTQFSASQVYTANTAAGLALNGTVFSAKVDNDTTAFDGGGNIIVKTGANLVTPNIGNATGNSLTLTGNGNISAANISLTGLMTATGNITGGNIITAGAVESSTVTATGNVAGGNLTTVGEVVATGNVAGGNLTTVGNVVATGNVAGEYIIANSAIIGNVEITDLEVGNVTATGFANITGNITGGNVSAGSGIISTTGNIDGGNINATAGITAGTTILATGNVSGGNVTTAGEVVATGNVSGGNITTGGIVNATGNLVTGANIVATGYANITGNINGSGAVFSGNVSAENFIGNISGNIDAGGANTNIQFNDGDILAGSAAFTFDKASNAVVASGNITGGNIDTGGQVVATGNVNGGNVTTAGQVVATGNVSGGNLTTAGQVVATGNVSGGNVVATELVTGANVSATSNVSGANVVGTTSVTGGNIVISGDDITDTNGRVNFNTAGADVDFAVNGDTVANVFYIDAGTGTASFGSSTQTTNALVAFNSTNSILFPVGNTAQRPATGVTGMLRFNSTTNALEVYDNTEWVSVGVPVFTVIDDQQFNGDGSTVAFTINSNQTTNSCIVSINGVVQVPTIAYSVTGTTLTFTEAPESGDLIDVRQITTTTTVVSISNTSGNAIVQVDDTTNNVSITGDLIPTANVTFDLGSSTMRWRDGYFAGNSITLGNTVMKNTGGNTIGFFGPDGTTPATIDASSVDTTTIANGTSSVAVIASGGNIRANVSGATIINITSGGIENGQANGVGNIGTTSTYFNTAFVKATSAQYADLAEKYVADAEYSPGTVVVFGGDREVTVSSVASDTAVAGVVSTNPSYTMNAGLEAEHVVTVALTGRVPTRVTGTIRKGDLMVSAGNGVARAEADPRVGTVIGKALENHEGTEGVIEVVVGRF